MDTYTMTVDMVNLTEGWDTLTGIDQTKGWINGRNKPSDKWIDLKMKKHYDGIAVPPGQTMTVEIGQVRNWIVTDGLFITLIWAKDNQNKFHVYSEMAASPGSTVFAGLVNASEPFSWNRKLQDQNNTNHYSRRDFDGREWVTQSDIFVAIDPVKLAYPNANIHVSVYPGLKSFEGKCVRSPDGAIYLVLELQARHIQDMEVYTGMFGSKQVFEDLPQATVNAMPKGPALNAKPPLIGSILGDGATYLVEEGRKRWIRDLKTFQYYNFVWDRVVATDVAKYADGPAIGV